MNAVRSRSLGEVEVVAVSDVMAGTVERFGAEFDGKHQRFTLRNAVFSANRVAMTRRVFAAGVWTGCFGGIDFSVRHLGRTTRLDGVALSVGTRNGVAPRDHVVHLYEDDDELIASVGAYLSAALHADEVAVAVMTPAHAAALGATLAAAGVDLDDARDSGNLILLDAADTMARFTVDDRLDPAAFHREVGGVIEHAAKRGQPVRVFGEMVAVLWNAGHVGAAIGLEALWNDLADRMPFSLYCAYAAQSVDGDHRRPELARVCELHSSVVGAAETARSFAVSPNAPTAARRFVVELLEMWGMRDVLADASLVTAELASNAVVHARTEFVVAVSARHGLVRISVRDGSCALPTSRVASAMATSGRGLSLISTLARTWGTELLGDGKIVWVDLAR